jgi:hypothetical protein
MMAQAFPGRLAKLRKRTETARNLDHATVDQEVGGSNPPSCTSARRNFLDKTPLAGRAPVALTHSHVSLEVPSFPRRGEK